MNPVRAPDESEKQAFVGTFRREKLSK